MTRDQALLELEQPLADEVQVRRDMKFIAKKLGIATDELEQLIVKQPIPHESYPNQKWLYKGLTSLRVGLRKLSLSLGLTRPNSKPENSTSAG